MKQERNHQVLCTNFKKLRKSMNLSQQFFGEILGITRPTIGAIEEFRSEVSTGTIKKIVDELEFIEKHELYDFMFNKDFKP